MAHRMSDQEVRDFLTGTPAHTGKLATIRADGRPHVAPDLVRPRPRPPVRRHPSGTSCSKPGRTR